VDENKAFDFCDDAVQYYENDPFIDTQVLAASLTSVEDVMRLAGIPHITISPVLLRELTDTDASSWKGVIGNMSPRVGESSKGTDLPDLVKDESRWRLGFTRSGFGRNEGKLISAINYFADFQEKLEKLVKDMLPKGDIMT
jgi:transaldolase